MWSSEKRMCDDVGWSSAAVAVPARRAFLMKAGAGTRRERLSASREHWKVARGWREVRASRRCQDGRMREDVVVVDDVEHQNRKKAKGRTFAHEGGRTLL